MSACEKEKDWWFTSDSVNQEENVPQYDQQGELNMITFLHQTFCNILKFPTKSSLKNDLEIRTICEIPKIR